MECEIRAADDRTRRILRAAASGDVLYLSTECPAFILRSICASGCTALHWAAGHSQVDAIRFLVLNVGMDVNVRARRKSRGRTPLHYACRNGHLSAARFLADELGANVDLRAKHGVTPFQLAVWQNRMDVCVWLVEERGVDAAQLNDFDCGAVHWIGICPAPRANSEEGMNEHFNRCSVGSKRVEDGAGLIPLCLWLSQRRGVDFSARQRQGHTPLHKAAWGGHIALLRHLRDYHGLLDDVQDDAGNYAADLADMANTDRHAEAAKFLREECSGARAESCRVLGVPVTAGRDEIRRAFLSKARLVHPDRLVKHGMQSQCDGEDLGGGIALESHSSQSKSACDFASVRKAYEHLTQENGIGTQSNPAHSLHLMLDIHASISSEPVQDSDEKDVFKARLITVLLEYKDDGIELCNIRKKWEQVWTGVPFPRFCEDGKRKKGALSDFIRKNAGDVVDFKEPLNKSGSIIVAPKKLTRAHVVNAASSLDPNT